MVAFSATYASLQAHAQSVPSPVEIPGSADPGRLDADPDEILPRQPSSEITLPDGSVARPDAPEDAENITFTLKNVTIKGTTAFTRQELADIYKPLIGKDIALSQAWEFAGRITKRYRNEGYFLSRAYIPAQEIVNGEITIAVVEGYINTVHLENADWESHVFQALRRRITNVRPVKLKDLENALLLLNDIPGLRFEALLVKDPSLPEGVVDIMIRQEKTKGRGSLRFDNHGSRFTGPFQTAFAYEKSFLPLQNTSLSGIASIPGGNDLYGLTLRHEARLNPETTLLFTLSRTRSNPGFTLSQFDIESQSFRWSAGFKRQIIRQRNENLDIELSVDCRNSDTDILGTASTRDRIRAVRAKLNYYGQDLFKGSNIINLVASQGIEGLGANNTGDPNLSRPAAEPDFTTLTARWQRQQIIAPDWLFQTTLTGQKASKALYASEEFGFGGPTLGRAYDNSEITGDEGVAATLDLSYIGLKPVHDIKFMPSVFYDIGKIWNIDEGQPNGLSAASAGLGLNMRHPSGINARLTLALPLTKPIDNSVQGNNGKNLRLFFSLAFSF